MLWVAETGNRSNVAAISQTHEPYHKPRQNTVNYTVHECISPQTGGPKSMLAMHWVFPAAILITAIYQTASLSYAVLQRQNRKTSRLTDTRPMLNVFCFGRYQHNNTLLQCH